MFFEGFIFVCFIVIKDLFRYGKSLKVKFLLGCLVFIGFLSIKRQEKLNILFVVFLVMLFVNFQDIGIYYSFGVVIQL